MHMNAINNSIKIYLAGHQGSSLTIIATHTFRCISSLDMWATQERAAPIPYNYQSPALILVQIFNFISVTIVPSSSICLVSWHCYKIENRNVFLYTFAQASFVILLKYVLVIMYYEVSGDSV